MAVASKTGWLPRQPETRVEFGDWQTPASLAERVVHLLRARVAAPASVLEPNCGDGAFLAAAADAFPLVPLCGMDINADHVATARKSLSGRAATISQADFFSVNWQQVVRSMPDPIWVLGNPPWVTNAGVSVVGGTNLPPKSNAKGVSGLDARTGKSNFDISEWMLVRLLDALAGKRFCLAMLCKSVVARQVLKHVADKALALQGALYTIDAKRHFDAAVDAVLLVVEPVASTATSLGWPVYESLDATHPRTHVGMWGGQLCSDVKAATQTGDLQGPSNLVWRSGLKHDCAKVMEFRVRDGVWRNGFGQSPSLQDEPCWFPLCKGSHVAAGGGPQHSVLVTQTKLGSPTTTLQHSAPKTWTYLQEHAHLFAHRKSKIYEGQPSFAMFGVGSYSFAPYKVAICGLYKHLRFCVVAPFEGKPVMLDDTCYFLPCESNEQAQDLCAALNGARAQNFFAARVFWDMKRPVSKALLSALSLTRLMDV